ncbi:hypothetical protein ABZ897_12875 [Nonomuraea sp. NPDC046802]|uniref:hypothetical protein n=1 Tax=Nonomuraea sp. NPDC046802 TaxID=3154919 RepID=UPI0033C022A3
MNRDEVRAYYDISENTQAMCDLLMRTHPGWIVQRLSTNRTLRSVPVWCARRASSPATQQALINENAGLLNMAMSMVDIEAVVS